MLWLNYEDFAINSSFLCSIWTGKIKRGMTERVNLKTTFTGDDIVNTRCECLLISSLPGKAMRTLVESRGLPSNSTWVSRSRVR